MFDNKLNGFCKDVNEVVRSKGFWDSMHQSLRAIDSQKDACDTDEKEKQIDFEYKSTKDAYVSQKIALIMSECGEALEAMRKENYGLGAKDTFEDEIADVFIRLADLCGELGIDIEAQIEWKLNLNKSRPAKHGKSF